MTDLGKQLLVAVAVMQFGATIQAGGALVHVQAGSSTRCLVNAADPGIGPKWTREDFDDSGWSVGRFGIGHEPRVGRGAAAMIETSVPWRTYSVYTRTTFMIEDVSRIRNLYFGVDYDDGFVAWINGQEILRSPSMPDGPPEWNSYPESHESSNAGNPVYGPLVEILDRVRPLLHEGANVLAVGVWNHGPESRDLFLMPRLLQDQPLDTFVTRGPYLQLATPTGITVRWSTDKPTDSRVAFGSRPGELDRSVVDGAETARHEMRLEGLKPDTTVCYAVGTSTTVLAGNDGEHCFRTAPPVGASRPTLIWVIGDSGTAGYSIGMTRRGFQRHLGDRRISVWLTLGDNAYPYGGDEAYQRSFFETFPDFLVGNAVWSTVGNHDRPPPQGVYYEVFNFPTAGEAGGVASGTEAYYSFDHGSTHFISLNSEEPAAFDEDRMVRWLQRDLEATTADWIIAFWHHAPYSTGLHDSDETPTMARMRTQVLPILEAGGVDLVLTGHTHAYERSYFLSGHYGSSATLTEDMLVDGGDGQLDGDGPYRKPKGKQGANRGTVYLVVGCSGEAMELDLHHPAMAVGLTKRGSVVLEIDGDRLHSEFVDIKGRVRDHFTIVKEDPPPVE